MDKYSLISSFKKPPVAVDIPGHGPVFLRVMTGTERASYFQSLPQAEKDVDFLNREKLLARCICDDQGTRIFGDGDFKDVAELPTDVLDALEQKAGDLNGLSAKAVDAAKKN